jgi:predicted dehydrogenase
MYRVKIFGAGSIGNHMANAARHLGWRVLVCDLSEEALVRMKNDIYPSRYGAWDTEIELYTVDEAPRGGFDVICVGTPPDTHLLAAMQALEEKPRILQIEKPLCPPSLNGAQALYESARDQGVDVFVGYDHVVGKATQKVEALLKEGVIGEIQTLDVEFREHWGGIFAAHHWLSGPEDSYLGFWERGGGASGEHSHALNLWQHLAHCVGAGRVSRVSATMRLVTQGQAVYDDLCFMTLQTESGLAGRVVQDVVTVPAQKKAKIQGTTGAIEWINGYDDGGDAVILSREDGSQELFQIPKIRPDDFIEELKHIQGQLEGEGAPSMRLERGLDTMLVIAGAHLSSQEGVGVDIDYTQSYTTDALKTSVPI